MTDYPCAACGFVVFDEPPGSYGICDVCGWEDDHVQLSHPTMRGGANAESLLEAQQRSLSLVPLEVRVYGDLVRDPQWRPLQPGDLEHDKPTSAPRDGTDYFNAAAGESTPYYWQVLRVTALESIFSDIDAKAPGKAALSLWIPEHLSWRSELVAQGLAMALVLERLVAHALVPDGFEQHEGGRVYRYKATA